MNLFEQIEEYDRKNPSMDIYTSVGSKILFTGNGGYTMENEIANAILTVGRIYTLSSIEVGGWSTSIELEEVPNSRFNSVMFQNIKPRIKEDCSLCGVTYWTTKEDDQRICPDCQEELIDA